MRRRQRAIAIGYQGFGNVGDEAILSGIERLLADGRLQVTTVICGDRAPVPAFPAARRIPSRRLLPDLHAARAMRSADVMLIAGGGLIHDHWPIVIPRYLAWSVMARSLGLRIAWIGVGVGPIRAGWARHLARMTARLAHAVTVRDQGSRGWLRRIGAEGEVVPDPAFFLEAPKHVGGDGLACIVRAPVPSAARLAGSLATALAELAATHASTQVTLATMEQEFDRDYARQVADRIAATTGVRPRMVVLPLEAERALALLARYDAIISVRLHGVILSALAGTPCVPVVYDEKVHAVAGQLGLGTIAVNLDQVSGALLRDRLTAAAAQDLRDQVRDRVERLRRQAERTRDLIEAAVNG